MTYQDDIDALAEIEKLRAKHVELAEAVEALDDTPLSGPMKKLYPQHRTKFHVYRAALSDALSDLDAITDEINEELAREQPDENAEHRLGEQLMGIR